MTVSIYNPPCYYLFTFAGSPCWALELLLCIYEREPLLPTLLKKREKPAKHFKWTTKFSKNKKKTKFGSKREAQQWSATSHFLHFESPHIARFFSTLFAAYLLCIARAIGAEPGARIYYYTRFLF